MSSSEPSVLTPGLADRYRVLLEIGRTLTGTLSQDELYRVIYRETARVLEASGFYISLYDPESDEARIVFFADRGEYKPVKISYKGSDSDVIRNGRSSLIEDRSASKPLLVLGEEQGELTRSAVTAALVHEGRVLGAISAQSYHPRAYTRQDLELLEGIASIASITIENARYVAELERRRAEADRIEEIGRLLTAALDPDEVLGKVIDACLALTRSDGAAVWLTSPEGTTLRVAASGGEVALPRDTEWRFEGILAERVLRDRTALIIPDLKSSGLIPDHLREVLSAGSGLAAPLLGSTEVLGVLTVGNKRRRAFRNEDARLLQRLAGQASLAMENARTHAKLQALTLIDPLTGLANRRHLHMHMQREVAAARRGRAVCLVIFDMDDFKKYNDTRGHAVGDDILRAFARVLAGENRASNLVARYGGDEFVAVLTDATREGAVQFTERIRELSGQDPVLSFYRANVTCGIACFDRARMHTQDDLLAAADADLYRLKGDRKR
jgi:diguanylate cyclase (GGDEF)-like protein